MVISDFAIKRPMITVVVSDRPTQLEDHVGSRNNLWGTGR